MKGRALSRYYTNKCLLLDENDFVYREGATFEDLTFETLDDVRDQFARCEFPELEILGICSERHDRSWRDKDCYAWPMWINDTSGWRGTFLNTLAERCRIEKPFAPDLIAAPEHAEAVLQDAMRRSTDAARYLDLRLQAEAALSLTHGYLPGFHPLITLDNSGEDQAIDARNRRYPDGRRLLVEIAYLWD